MNFIKLQNELADDEGIKYELYLCSENHLTGGIGHLITEWDADYYGKPIGYPVPNEQVNTWFEKDIDVTINDCKIIFEEFDSLPEEAQLVIANMCFQLGRPRLSKFKKFIAAVKEQDWERAADEMKDSRWYKQTTARAERLISRIQILGVPV